MATKLNNEHLETIILNSNKYHTLDVYIALAHISSEVKGRYLIQTYSSNKADLVNQIKKYINISYKTIYNNLDKLIDLNILAYDLGLSSWSLIGMEKMTKSKASVDSLEEMSSLKGYTKIREFFLDPTFHKMKAIEKRFIVYLAQLFDSKASKSYKEFVTNLLKHNSSWLKILKTNCKYYGKYTISNILEKYKDIFTDNSEALRSKDIAPKKISSFKFAFNCSVIEKVGNDNSQYDLIKKYHEKELTLVKDKASFGNITLSKTEMMHIVRAIATIKEWFLKERVVQIIINKYIAIHIHQSREKIKSLPAYLVAVVKGVINDYNIFKETIQGLDKSALELSYLQGVTPKECNTDLDDDIAMILQAL